MRDVRWSTNTCPFSWATQGPNFRLVLVFICGVDFAGVFDQSQDGTEVLCVDALRDRALVAAGDDYGRLSLMRWPALEATNERYTATSGHAGHVRAVRFSADGKFLFSVGGPDRTLLQWRVKHLR